MHVSVWNILIVSLTMPTGTNTITVSDRKFSLVLYTPTKTWNEAQAICAKDNGTLFSQDSPEKGHVIYAYTADTSWPKTDVWIGLHYPVAESNNTFGWLSCDSQSGTQYDNWKSNEPGTGTSSRCASLDKNSFEWRTDDCSNSLIFLCENRGDPCTHQLTLQSPSSAAIFDDVTSTEATMANCWEKCLTETYNNRNCWALNWDSSSASGWGSSPVNNCVRYFVDDPFYFTGLTLQPSSKKFLLKECYSISVVDSLSVTVPSDGSSNPDKGCSTFSPTKTQAGASTTTTTTEATTTTTVATTSPPTATTPAASTALVTSTTTVVVTSTTTSKPSSTFITSVSSSSVSANSSPEMTTLSAITTTTGVNKCFCSCKKLKDLVKSRVSDIKLLNLTLAEKVLYLQQRLKLNASNLSATKRRLNSAQDDRTEAQALGYIGITFICVILVPVVLSDIFKLLAYIHTLCKKHSQVASANEPSSTNDGQTSN